MAKLILICVPINARFSVSAISIVRRSDALVSEKKLKRRQRIIIPPTLCTEISVKLIKEVMISQGSSMFKGPV